MLAVENAEIGGTLIALSVPGLKPLFQRWFANVDMSFSRSRSNGTHISLGSKSKLQSDHKLEREDHYEPAASEVSVHVTSVRNRESNDSLSEAGSGYLGSGAHDVTEINGTAHQTSSASIPMRPIPKK